MAVVSLTTVADTYVKRYRGTGDGMNYGGDTGLAALNTSSEYAEVYVLFDLSSIPSASKINSATFELALRGGGYFNITVDMRKVTSGWQEYAVTYNNKPSISNEVYGSIFSPNFNPPDPEIASFDATAMVREWISGQSPNYGFALTSPNGNRIFGSREGAAAYGYMPPTLVIDYEPNHAPNAPGLNTPGHGSITNNRNPVFNWTFSDQDGGDYQTAWQIQVSAGDGGAFTNIYMDSGKNTTATNQWTFYNFGDNQYFYRIRTWDRYDAVSPWSWVPWFGIENQPPTCTGGTPSPRYLKVDPGGSFRVEVTGVSDNWSGVQKVQFATWTEAGGQDDIRWYDGVNAGGGTWYYDVPLANHGNAEGKYNCHVYAWDFAGNSANIRVIDTYIDRTPPNVGSVSGPHYTNQAGGTFRVWAYNVTDSSGVNRVSFPTCHTSNTSVWKWYPGVRDGGSNNWYCDIQMGEFANAEGTYFSDVYAYDNVGNQAPSVRIVTYVDRTPPTVASVQGLSYTNQTGGTRRVWIYGAADAVSGIASVEVIYYATGLTFRGPFPAGQSGNDYYYDVPIYVGDDRYKAEFRLHDRAGNTGYYKVEFLVDSQRPNDPNGSVTYGETTVTFTWLRFSDPFPSSEYERTELTFGEWDGSAWAGGFPNRHMGVVTTDANTLEKYFSNLNPGVRYRYTVKHFDKAGNESAYTWREFVTKKKIGEIYVPLSPIKFIILPLYDPQSGVLGSKEIRSTISNGVIGCFETVQIRDPSASKVKAQTSQGIRAIAKN
ncbi:GBS Bsp-like repeat-containing protein [Paenibacillus tyrfis]|uniref:Carbohydrate-binding module family 96 domain-containing protein n=1 Tax=Paenibacillus tyrfis TaxID=1501230 RepID=A0A081NWR4_9BACL|nr:GBS Bsp-like repeat-containing protein [Paenibacillus tyrfis]KEQ22887.1 hypothetical protein ET33_21320 [Paenibacillus tyrfis]